MKSAVLLLAVLVGSAAQASAPSASRLPFVAAALSSVTVQLLHVDARRNKNRPVAKATQPSSSPQSVAAKALLKQGKDAQRLGDGARAMSLFEQAAEVAKADGDGGSAARAHGAAGRLLLSVGQGKQAAERLGHAVAADPTYSAGHLNLAHAHLTNGDHRRGQIAIATPVLDDGCGGHFMKPPICASPCHNLRPYAGVLAFPCACAGLRVVRHFLDGTPDNADAHRILGHLLAATGDSVAAEAAWRTAIKYKPNDSESHQALALSLFGAMTYAFSVACPSSRLLPVSVAL